MDIAVLGNWGYGTNSANGQTIKTKNLCKAIENYTEYTLTIVKTNQWKQHPIKLLCEIRKAFSACDVIIMLPAHSGVKLFGPLLVFFNKIYRKKIFYDVVGGWLPDMLNSHHSLMKNLKRFNGIWVETAMMQDLLQQQGFSNISVVPNFKDLSVLDESDLVYPEGIPLRLCTFSRVMKEKGIETAVSMIKEINTDFGYTVFSLDIYGQIEGGQEQWFAELEGNFPEYVHYNGCVDSEKSVEVLKNYFMLLFPTYYEGEGFAGTLIDAFSAGVPVIASDWKYNSEIVNEKVGYIYSAGEEKELGNTLLYCVRNINEALCKKTACLNEADKYDSKIIIKRIQKLVEI